MENKEIKVRKPRIKFANDEERKKAHQLQKNAWGARHKEYFNKYYEEKRDKPYYNHYKEELITTQKKRMGKV